VHELVGDALPDEAAHYTGQRVLQELDAKAAGAGAGTVVSPRLAGLEHGAGHARQQPLQTWTGTATAVSQGVPVTCAGLAI